MALHDRVTTNEDGKVSKIGVVDGTSALAGEVGEYLETTGAMTPITASWVVSNPLNLTPGDWDLTAVFASLNKAGVSTTGVQINLSLTTSTGSADQLDLFSYVQVAANAQKGAAATIPNYRVSITSADSYYLKALAAGGNFANAVSYKISARRIR